MANQENSDQNVSQVPTIIEWWKDFYAKIIQHDRDCDKGRQGIEMLNYIGITLELIQYVRTSKTEYKDKDENKDKREADNIWEEVLLRMDNSDDRDSVIHWFHVNRKISEFYDAYHSSTSVS